MRTKLCTLMGILLAYSLNGYAAFATHFLNISTWRTANGIPVYFVATQQLPIVDINIAFDAGSARDGEQYGIANLTNQLLSDGVAGKNADAIANQFENVGARFNNNVGLDMATLQLRSLNDDLSLFPALKLFNQILTSPSFPEKDLGREKRLAENALQAMQESPAQMATQVLFASLYDEARYGHPIEGTSQRLTQISRAQVQQFWKKYYTVQNAVITITGNVTSDKAHRIAEVLSQHLNKGKAISPLKPASLKPALTRHIPFDVSQTQIRLGMPALDRKNPHYVPLVVANQILGGGALTSRLFNEIRQKRGLSYDVDSFFWPLMAKGPFVVSLQTKTVQTDAAITVLKNTLQTFITEGPSETEMTSAKAYLLGSFPLRFDSNAALSSNLLTLAFYHLPLDYFDQYYANIAKQTKTDVHQAFQNTVQLNHLALITVGREAEKA